MNFNFNIGGVRVTYQTSSGRVRETVLYTRSAFNHVEQTYTMVEAHQTTIQAPQ